MNPDASGRTGLATPPSRGLPIAARLTLLLGALLVVVMVIYAWAAYQEVRRAATTVAEARLHAVTTQLAGMLEGSRDQFRGLVRIQGRLPAVQRYLVHRDSAGRAAVEAALHPAGPDTLEVPLVQLLDARRLILAAVSRPEAAWAGALADSVLLDAALVSDSGAVGGFHAVGDTIVYASAVALRQGGALLGYLVQWRRLTEGRNPRGQIAQLIGSDAQLIIGNRSDGVWTDLVYRVPAPPIDVVKATGPMQYQRAGSGELLATAVPVPETPWYVVVEFSRAATLAPAHLFVRRLALVGGGILVVGLVAAWLLSRTITRPLVRLTDAAEAVAGGNWGQPIRLARRDELGRLAGAFDSMVHHVREAQERLEERVRARTAELQERNADLEAFAYSLAHDLRAPLRAMEGFSQALREDYGSRLDDKGLRYTQVIADAAATMGRMIQDLLAYSRLAREELPLGRLEVPPIVRRAAEQVAVDVTDRGAQVTIDDELPEVVGHPSTLVQVFANLIANGIKFVPSGRTPTVRVRGERGNGSVRIWVEDNGIGILPEHRERIFGVFERLHQVEEFPGTGIGLAIVKKGVERMGGQVGVDSNPGEGSRFWVQLPSVEVLHGA
jgi:signal transduction histidine kinase